MGRLIIITGHLASLKSTVSTILSKDLEVMCLNKDTIKEVLGDAIGFSSVEDSQTLSRATYKLIKSLALNALSLNQTIIIESNFKKEELDDLKRDINVNDTTVITLFFTANSETLYKRYVARQPYRHLVHTSTGLMDYEAFKRSMIERNINDCFGDVYEVDTSVFSDDAYSELLNRIKLS